VGVSDLASLLPGIAAVITSLSGAFVAIFAITRGSKREREQAAQSAIDRVLGDDEDDELAAVLEEILRQRKDGES
jgi:hypothetical protein